MATIKRDGYNEPKCWVKYPELRPSRGKNQKKKDEDDNPVLSVMALSTRSGLNRHSWCFDNGIAKHIIYIHANFESYTLNNGSLQTVLTANGPATPLDSGTVRMEIKGYNSKPLKLELKDILYLLFILVNLFSRQ